MIPNIPLDDTIVAISSPYGMGGVAIIRCSGKQALWILKKIFRTKNKTPFLWDQLTFRKMYYGLIVDSEQVIDEVMVCAFQSPHSYTGEDVVEIYCHGSIYVQQKILSLCIQHGARLATAGEFTIRACMNGKLTLSDAEALGDLIHAETEAAHRLAIDQLRGGYKTLLQQLRSQLLNVSSLLELELDFSEEDIEFASRHELIQLLTATIQTIEELTKSFQMGNVIKNGVPVVILGKPNAGKSTLLNALLNEEKAIVSEIPGTTRDLIEDILIIQGVSFRIIDTAGIREARDEIEKIGITRTKQSVKKAMIALLIIDISEYQETEIIENEKMIDSIHPNITLIKVFNKIDKIPHLPSSEQNDCVFISAKEKKNIEKLKQKLFDVLIQKGYQPHQPMVSNLRHYYELQHAAKYLQNALQLIKNQSDKELIAEDLRFAILHLSNITGTITSEEILANIFSKFCIGK